MKIQLKQIQILPLKCIGGLCGFASCILNDSFFLGNIAIYSSPSSKHGFRVVFPNKKLPSGKVLDVFYPVCKEAGEAIQEAVVNEYLQVMDKFNNN